MTNLTGRYFIDCTISGENVYRVTRVNEAADLVWVEPTEKFKNTQSPRIYEGKLFKSLVRKGRIILN